MCTEYLKLKEVGPPRSVTGAKELKALLVEYVGLLGIIFAGV